MDLTVRSDRAEAMDDPGLDPAVYARCIGDLARVNAVTMTHRPVLRWLANAAPAEGFSVLDVAYGNGDLLRAIARWAERRGIAVRLSGIDLNPRSAEAARKATPDALSIDYRTGDVFGYEPDALPDFIVTSQFTHHLAEPELVTLVRWMQRTALRGWYIADLQRHAVPYYGFRVLGLVMGWHRIVRSDGTISIARGFHREEWRSVLERAGVAADISWQFPFRFGVSHLT